MGLVMKCFKCEQEIPILGPGLEDKEDSVGVNLDEGVRFYAYGSYGSTVFDPNDGSQLVIAICDTCLASRAKAEFIRHVRYSRKTVLEYNEPWGYEA